jgi:hypothetical protein
VSVAALQITDLLGPVIVRHVYLGVSVADLEPGKKRD